MGSDQEATCEKDCKFLFDDFRVEMERVKPLLDLDHWARACGDEEFKELLDDLAEEGKRKRKNSTYKLAECFTECIKNDGKDDGSDNWAFYMALIEELGIEPQAVKYVKDDYFDITLPMSDGQFTVRVKPFDPYVPEPWRSEVIKKADDQRVDPRWHYFVSWAKYWDVILNSNSEYAAKLRERDPEHAKRETPTDFSNAVMKKWLRKS
jgi:hypothetical protein